MLKSRASLQEAFHSREVSCVHNFRWPSVGRHTANGEVLVTSGEDTDIKMWEVGDTSSSSGRLRHLKTLTGHISSVKALKSVGHPLESGAVTDAFFIIVGKIRQSNTIHSYHFYQLRSGMVEKINSKIIL